jgi:uncharacterized cupredoxin-like copper-binding protein
MFASQEKKRWLLPKIIGMSMILAMVLTACGSASASSQATATPTPAGPQKVQVTEKDFSITLSTNVVSPGEIEFDLTNQGPSEHEFVIFKTDLAPDKLPTNNGIVDESASSLTKVFEQSQYAANSSKTVNVQLDAGSYVVICNLPGHYLQGMHAALTVTPDAGPTQTAMAENQSQATATPAPQPTATQSAGANETQGTMVNVIEKNFDIFVDRDSVPAGTVTFNLRNEGVSTHEFVIFKTDLPADGLPVKDAQVNESASNLQKIDEQQEFPPGETRQLTVQLDPGHYVLMCNLPDHYQQGMRIDFTVAAASAGQSSSSTSTSSQTNSSGTSTKISVIEQNYGIYLNRVMAPAGQIEFDLSNLGPDQHEFVVFKTDLAPDQLPVNNAQVVEDDPSLQKMDEQQEYPSGDTRTLTLNLDPGNYVLICNIVGHYQQGMHIGFTVTDSSGTSNPIVPVPESTGKVSVIEKNYGIYLNTAAIPAGQVEFDLSNLGPDQHEFVVFKTDLAPDKLPVQNGQVVEDAPSLQKINEQQEYPSGDTRTLSVTLDPGHYVLICNIVGHYQQGMHVGFTVAGSSSSSSPTPTSQPTTTQAPATVAPGKISVIEENYALFLNRSSIPAGQIEFDLSNMGPDQHEFVVFKTDLAPDRLPLKDGQVVEDAASLQKIGEQDQYASGTSKTLTLNLQPGHYVVICNLPGHYEQGMRFGLTVTTAHERVKVIEENFAILLDRSSVPAGTVDFALSNLGPDEHEFVVFKTYLRPENLPVENGQVVEDAPSLVKIGEQDQYPANENRLLSLDLDAGHYVLICNLPGHYEQGMYFELTITPD